MLRVHFTADDLLDTAFLVEGAPLFETNLAVSALQRRDGGPGFDRWRRRQIGRLPRPALAMLELVTATPRWPHFIDQSSADLNEALDQMRSTDTFWVTSELVEATGARRPSTFVRALAARDNTTWRVLDRAMRDAYSTLVEPNLPGLRTAAQADVAYRARLMTTVGLRRTLTALFPDSRWQDSTLEIKRSRSAEVKLNGRGLRLLASPLWSGEPGITLDASGRYLLVYSTLATPSVLGEPRSEDPLESLLGRTRAAVLRSLTEELSTTELARVLGIGLSSASEHAKALRAAGLVSSERAGKAVRHTCSALGHGLLEACR